MSTDRSGDPPPTGVKNKVMGPPQGSCLPLEPGGHFKRETPPPWDLAVDSSKWGGEPEPVRKLKNYLHLKGSSEEAVGLALHLSQRGNKEVWSGPRVTRSDHG